MTAKRTAFEKIHVLLQVDPTPGREAAFHADAQALISDGLNLAGLKLAIFGSLTADSTDLSLTVTLPVDVSPAVLSAVQETPGILDREATRRIHDAIAGYVRTATGTTLAVRVRHSLLAPAASSPAMPVALAAA